MSGTGHTRHPEVEAAQTAAIYGLADLRPLQSHAKTIEDIVLTALHAKRTSNHRVLFNPRSSSFRFNVANELWTRRTPPILPDRTTAKKAAERALSNLAEALSGANEKWPKPLRDLSLLPSGLSSCLSNLTCVARPSESFFDHWLYRVVPQLSLGDGSDRRVAVYGAQIDVRIGHGGLPVDVRCRWRPVTADRLDSPLADFEAPPPAHGDADHEENGDHPGAEEQPTLVYVLEGEGSPQYYMAPYYALRDHAGIVLVSASPYSLTIHLARTRQVREKMTVSAFVRGGSGDYSYNWACYPLTSPDLGLTELGPGTIEELETSKGPVKSSSIDLELGAYNVLLNVKDNLTGAFKHAQRLVFSRGAPLLKQ